MTGKAFYKWIESDPRFVWSGCKEEEKPEDDYVVITNKQTSVRFKFFVAALKDAKKSDIEGVLTGQRPPQVMKGVTRIVGYYSFTYAWNKSKLAELMDRKRGNYTVPETPQPTINPDTQPFTDACDNVNKDDVDLPPSDADGLFDDEGREPAQCADMGEDGQTDDDPEAEADDE